MGSSFLASLSGRRRRRKASRVGTGANRPAPASSIPYAALGRLFRAHAPRRGLDGSRRLGKVRGPFRGRARARFARPARHRPHDRTLPPPPPFPHHARHAHHAHQVPHAHHAPPARNTRRDRAAARLQPPRPTFSPKRNNEGAVASPLGHRNPRSPGANAAPSFKIRAAPSLAAQESEDPRSPPPFEPARLVSDCRTRQRARHEPLPPPRTPPARPSTPRGQNPVGVRRRPRTSFRPSHSPDAPSLRLHRAPGESISLPAGRFRPGGSPPPGQRISSATRGPTPITPARRRIRPISSLVENGLQPASLSNAIDRSNSINCIRPQIFTIRS